MKEKILELNKERNIFWILLFAMGISFAFYVYFVSQMTLNTIQRQNLQNKIGDVHFSLGSLEGEYISKKNSVNIEYAYGLGFKDASHITYISKKSLGETLSFNNEI